MSRTESRRRLALATVLALSACAGTPPHAMTSAASVATQATFPPGAEGTLIRYGHDIVVDTSHKARGYVRAAMSCQDCHLDAGRKPHAGSFLGIYADFPQYNGRAHRFIMLQDRIAECFLYSMNGRPPTYNSREMEAISAYIAFLSRDARVGQGFADQGPVSVAPASTASASAGMTLYAAKCSMCHAASGAGIAGEFPPLWGPKSFNDGAGMARTSTFAAFVKYNMPLNAPGTLSDSEAYDLAAYVLQPAHRRPHFDGSRSIAFPAESASFF